MATNKLLLHTDRFSVDDSSISRHTSSYICIPLRAIVECNCISPSIAESFISTLVLRGLLGVVEAALFPGVPFLLSFSFKGDALAF